jgi:ribonuclease Z
MNRLYLLGAGTPTPTRHRFGTSYVLELADDLIMIDCGPGTTYKLVKAGLWPTQIDYLFFTHHHFDHNADYPCFLLCRWDQSTGREGKLRVWGPEPTALITRGLIGPEGAFADDWKARVGAPVSQAVHRNRGGSLPRPKPHVEVADIGRGPVTAGSGWKATAAEVHHVQPFLKSLAYRFDSPAGSIAFAGDTDSVEAVSALAQGCDVLVVNCWDVQERMDANGEGPGQTGTADAAHMAAGAAAKTLVLTHTGPALCEPEAREKGIAEIRRIYNGRIVFAEELMTLELF